MGQLLRCLLWGWILFISAKDVLASEKMSAKGVRDLKGIVTNTFQIHLDAFPEGFNPSIIEITEGYVLTFRHLPEPVKKPWISYIGVVLLDRQFQQISPVSLLDARQKNYLTPSQTEDARIFCYRGDLYVIYNDNPDITNTTAHDRRDIYIAKVTFANQRFTLSEPLRLIHPRMYKKRLWEKNWVPFVWNDTLFLSYSLHPHEVLAVNFDTGECLPIHTTAGDVTWKWGKLRGGSPATLIDGEYFGFFHSAMEMASGATGGGALWHYFMGAYTFSPKPPFEVTRISPLPINERTFYLESTNPKRVVYPGGYVIAGNKIYVAYGKDDREMWVAEINKEKLMRSLHPVSSIN